MNNQTATVPALLTINGYRYKLINDSVPPYMYVNGYYYKLESEQNGKGKPQSHKKSSKNAGTDYTDNQKNQKTPIEIDTTWDTETQDEEDNILTPELPTKTERSIKPKARPLSMVKEVLNAYDTSGDLHSPMIKEILRSTSLGKTYLKSMVKGKSGDKDWRNKITDALGRYWEDIDPESYRYYLSNQMAIETDY
jgi:hypothetical protein